MVQSPPVSDTAYAFPVLLRRVGRGVTAVALVLGWWLLYRHLALAADWVTFTALRLPRAPGERLIDHVGCCSQALLAPEQIAVSMRLGRAVFFLLFQLPHLLLLLLPLVFIMGVVRSYFTPEATRAALMGRRTFTGKSLAVLLGVVTPFCSCSAVPLFLGFLTAGVPLGVTLTFLITAPMVNEVALGLLLDSFGWKIAAIYAFAGITLALGIGWLLERLHMERWVEDWVLAPRPTDAPATTRLTWEDRLRVGGQAACEVWGRVWLFVLLGLAAGAALFAFVPQDALIALLGARHWWSVPLAVLVGAPLYANPAGILPVVQALQSRGVPPGTLVAFLMSVVGLSLPEFILLRRALRWPLLLAFAGLLAGGIMVVGVVMNWVVR